MKTLEELKEEIELILREPDIDLDPSSASFNILSNLLTKFVYHKNIETASLVSETDENNLKFLSSAIVHANNKGYSVFRGSNQKITIKDCTLLTQDNNNNQLVFNKYHLETSVDGLGLYFAEDYVWETADINQKKDITFIISDKPPFTAKVNWNDKHSFDLIDEDGNILEDISEDVRLYNTGGNELTFNTNIKDYSRADLNHPDTKYSGGYVPNYMKNYLLQTIASFGINISSYPFNELLNTSTNRVDEVKGFYYTPENIDIANIVSLKNFKFDSNIDNGNILSIDYKARHEDKKEIKHRSDFYWYSRDVIKSRDDLQLNLQTILNDTNYPISSSNIFVRPNNVVILYDVDKEQSTTFTLSDDDKDDITNEIKSSYLLDIDNNKVFEFQKVQPYGDKTMSYNIDIKVSDGAVTEITQLENEFFNTIYEAGSTVSIYDLIHKIVKLSVVEGFNITELTNGEITFPQIDDSNPIYGYLIDKENTKINILL